MAYFNLSNAFPYKAPLLRAQLDALAENDQHLKDHHWQDGSRTVFHQAAVPLGWTLAPYASDRWLRVVSGLGGGSGGSHLPSSPILFQHTHTVIAAPDHTHLAATHWHDLAAFDTVNGIIGPTATAVFGHGDVDLIWAEQGGTNTIDQIKTRLEAVDSVASNPAGGHNHVIGQMGANIQLAYADVIVGERLPSAGYTDMTNFFQVNQKIDFEPFYNELRANDEYLKDRIAVGARHVLFNAVAPPGWLKLSAAGNGYGLRTNTVGGGIQAGTLMGVTMFFSHEHAHPLLPAHSHLAPNHRHSFQHFPQSNYAFGGGYIGQSGGKLRPRSYGAVDNQIFRGRTDSDGGGAAMGAAGQHFHVDTVMPLQNIQLAYLDMILVEKQDTGAPFPYSLHPQTIAFKKLVSKQRLQALGRNDEHLKFHIQQPGMRALFYQATPPINWTLVVTHHDKFLRFNNAAGGTFGGSHPLSATIPLEHTHLWTTVNHFHTIPAHVHTLQSRNTSTGTLYPDDVTPWSMATQSGLVPLKGTAHVAYVGPEALWAPPEGFPARPQTGPQQVADSNVHGHTHELTTFGIDVNLAYVDVILCEKG